MNLIGLMDADLVKCLVHQSFGEIRLKKQKKKNKIKPSFVSCSRARHSIPPASGLFVFFFNWSNNFCDQCIQVAREVATVAAADSVT